VAPPTSSYPRKDVHDEMATQRIRAAEPPPPPAHPFVEGVFNFPWYRTNVWKWFMFAFELTVSFGLFALAYTMGGPLGVGFASAGVILIGCFAMAYGTAHALAIIEDTAAGFDEIEEWPSAEWREWFIQLFEQIYLISFAVLAGFAARQLFGKDVVWLQLVPMVLVYPVVLLSRMECDSVLLPFSVPVLWSLVRLAGDWFVFYLELLALWVGVFLLMDWLAALIGWGVAAVAGLILATGFFISARLIGRMGMQLIAAGELLTGKEEEKEDEDEAGD
jgi:hypothetical protein